MEFTPIPMATIDTMKRSVEKLLEDLPSPHVAAFDADGTLWDSDLGEQFFQYQIEHCQLPKLKEVGDPWKYYRESKSEDPRAAYLWLAQINRGQKIEQVRAWATDAIEKGEVRVFPDQRE